MENKVIDQKVLRQIEKLEQKYEAMGQDLSSYLDGLLHADYLTYWDYIHLDTLLSLQTPRTHFADEKIFIIYHQITELYFKLIINEQEQLIYTDPVDPNIFLKRIKRMNRYFDHLIDSFDVMIDGMDQDQFLQFRMSLLPSSGFQSAQYRHIEINSTAFENLAPNTNQEQVQESPEIESIYQHLYWRKGATELATGLKTLTLRQFEEKYREAFIKQAKEVRSRNLLALFLQSHNGEENIIEALRHFDHKANVLWPLAHLRSAVRYLQKDPHVIKATGGTNWQKYLPPINQRIMFYPSLWSDEEKSSWGSSTSID